MHDRKISKISESSESTKKVKNFINSIEFDYDKFGLPKEEIKKLKNKHEKKQAKNLKTNKQAEFLFDKLYGETKDNMNIKKAAIIYSANSKQSIELYEYYENDKKNYENFKKIIYGSNQAEIFKKITEKFSDNTVAERNFHIVPITTVTKGITALTDDSCATAHEIVRDLLNILRHLNNGWNLYVLENTEEMKNKPGEKKYQVGNGKAKEVFYGNETGIIKGITGVIDFGGESFSYGDFVQKFIDVLFELYGEKSNLPQETIAPLKEELQKELENMLINFNEEKKEKKYNMNVTEEKKKLSPNMFRLFFNDNVRNQSQEKQKENNFSSERDNENNNNSTSTQSSKSMQSLISSPRSPVKKTPREHKSKQAKTNQKDNTNNQSKSINNITKNKNEESSSFSPRKNNDNPKIRSSEDSKKNNSTRETESEKTVNNYDVFKNYPAMKKFQELVGLHVNAENADYRFHFQINEKSNQLVLNIELCNEKSLKEIFQDNYIKTVLETLKNNLVKCLDSINMGKNYLLNYDIENKKLTINFKSLETLLKTINILEDAGGENFYKTSQFANSSASFFSQPKNDAKSYKSDNQPEVVDEISYCRIQ